MNKTTIGCLLFFWMIATIFLSLSILGWVIIFPMPKTSDYNIESLSSRRSTWMQIGFDLKDSLLKSDTK